MGIFLPLKISKITTSFSKFLDELKAIFFKSKKETFSSTNSAKSLLIFGNLGKLLNLIFFLERTKFKRDQSIVQKNTSCLILNESKIFFDKDPIDEITSSFNL